jgi:hypothetical protein
MKEERRKMEVKSKAMCLSMSFDDSEMLRVNLVISTKKSVGQYRAPICGLLVNSPVMCCQDLRSRPVLME